MAHQAMVVSLLLVAVGQLGWSQVPLPLKPGTLAWPLKGNELTVIPDYSIPRFLDTRATVFRPRPDRPITREDLQARQLPEEVPLYVGAPEFAVGTAFLAPFGAEVLAVDGGQVAWAEFRPNEWGLAVAIRHASGFLSVYGHLSKVTVRTGDEVASGELIGYVGNTGVSLQPHLFLVLLIEVPGIRVPFPRRHYVSPLGFLRTGDTVLAGD
jgi:hypothetical protein